MDRRAAVSCVARQRDMLQVWHASWSLATGNGRATRSSSHLARYHRGGDLRRRDDQFALGPEGNLTAVDRGSVPLRPCMPRASAAAPSASQIKGLPRQSKHRSPRGRSVGRAESGGADTRHEPPRRAPAWTRASCHCDGIGSAVSGGKSVSVARACALASSRRPARRSSSTPIRRSLKYSMLVRP